jgi:hypothetical protein
MKKVNPSKLHSGLEPVVNEVRRARAKLWREAGGTIAGLVKLMDAYQAAGYQVRETRVRPRKSGRGRS